MLLLTFLCSIRYWPVLEAARWILQSSNVICYDKSCELFWEVESFSALNSDAFSTDCVCGFSGMSIFLLPAS